VDVAALGVIALVLARTLALVGLATRQARRLAPRAHSGQLVSVVIPAWNEQASLEQTAAAVLASDYPALELIIIDDGSTDDTARLADELARTDARVVVHHHGSNQGKPAALNAGFARARGAVVITVDADTRLERHCVAHLVAALETSGAQAVAANVKVANRGGWLGVWQSLEYVVSLNVGRRAHDLAGSITTVPGAASAWRRQAVLDAGGFSARSLTEDTDLSLVLLRRGGRLHYAPAALAFTTVPERPGALFRQRRRWLFGNVSCVRLHLGCLRGVTPTRLRWVGYPDFVFTTVVIYVLPLLALAWAPHAVALWGAGACVAAVATLFGVDLLVAVLAYALDGERKRELLHAPLARLVWPFFLWVVLLGAGAFALRGRRPPWRGRPLLQR
jgi:cellulose synthase/poly-beta-1,6-N-acetylglucosamine synthase-like glycosyltransferase